MKSPTLPKWLVIIGLLTLLTLILAAPTKAFDGRGGDTLVIPADEVVNDDLYVGAADFTLNGAVKGDLLAVGRNITINGVVEGDLIAAGQSVIINGVIQDDARIAAAAMTLGENANIGDDVIAAGYGLETKDGSAVGGAVVFAGGQLLHAGKIAGDMQMAGGGLELRGSVGGNVKAELGGKEDMPPFSPLVFMPDAPAVPGIDGGLKVGENAKIGGNLEYASPVEATVPRGAIGGQIQHLTREISLDEEAERAVAFGSGRWLLMHLRTLVTLILVGLLMTWLIPNFIKQGAATIQTRLWPSLGWGGVAIFAIFFAVLVLIAATALLAIIFGFSSLGDLVGTTIWIGVLAVLALLVASSIAIAYVSKILVAYLGGKLLLARYKPEWAESKIWSLVVGLVIFVILAAIPWLGSLFSLAAVLFGLGALWLMGQKWLLPQPKVAAQ